MVQCLGISIEILGCPSDKTPLSAVLMLSRGKQSSTPGIRLAAEIAGKIAQLQSDHLWGFTPVVFRVESLSLYYSIGDHKAGVLCDPFLGSVCEHQGLFHSPVGLHTACLGTDLL